MTSNKTRKKHNKNHTEKVKEEEGGGGKLNYKQCPNTKRFWDFSYKIQYFDAMFKYFNFDDHQFD